MKIIYFSGLENKDFSPKLVGHYACPSSNTFGPHVRDHHILHCVIKGKGVLINSRGTHPVSKGETFLIRKDEKTTYIADKDDPWEYVWIGFYGSRAKEFDDAPDVFKTPAELDMKLLEHVDRDIKSADIYLSILYEMTYHIFEAENNPQDDEWIRNVHRAIKYNYMQDISISGLAAEFGFERSYLYRAFKERYGMSPKEYLTITRLEKSKWLLSQGYSVAESAYMVGYSDPFSFSKAYKKHFGVAPSHDDIS